MDSNKDEAAKCMRIGRAAIEAGDKQRALRFLSIAKRLYPSPQVDALISSLHEENGQQGADDMETDVAVGGEESGQRSGGQREQNVFINGKHQNGYRNSSASTAEVLVEHREIVRKINKTKDFYQILGLEKECTEDDVRKAYRKLSLKVHPDKNKAPGAEEAFKAVSKAFQVLNNVELREDYDRYGPEERETSQQMRQQQHHHHGRHGNVYYEDMFDPNDIFNSFFFGMQQPNGPFRRAQFVRAQIQGKELQLEGVRKAILATFLVCYSSCQYLPCSFSVSSHFHNNQSTIWNQLHHTRFYKRQVSMV
jgi:DnaJ family protein B protein 12